MESIKRFLIDYWEYCQWYLIGLAAVSLILLFPFRQRGKAAGLLLLGLYVTMSVYFLSVYRDLGFTDTTSLGVVIVFGLALGATFYYFFFIRAE